MIYKRRQRQSGDSQYEKVAGVSQKFEVSEYGVRVLVNLTDYLDTGLFLDHRPVRKWIQDNSSEKRFLNLFCYTGVATMHAVKGGAVSSISVDMSNTYLGWAKENLAINGFSGNKHVFERDDCMEWVKGTKEKFDLIFLDPPTFSNSKKMQGIFDVQRDHVVLIDECMRLLDQSGVLLFSNNLRKFILDNSVYSKFDVQEITGKTIDQDFKRNAGIHHCWIIREKT
jgi:23S rRNA (guanine2445-N2)-methyltransferase / 23S rRNA (guanine2069-N7)-methyltransferase